METFLLLASIFMFSLVTGWIFEKFKIPWLFAPLIFGVILNEIGISSSEIASLGSLGMYFMLFLVGFELDLEKIRKTSHIIINTTLAIQILSTTAWTLILLALGYPFIVALIVGLTAHCVGEAVLVPILDEFKLLKSKIGTAIIGIGTLDDVFEVAALLLAGSLITSQRVSVENVGKAIFILLIIAAITLVMIKVEGLKSKIMRVPKVEELLLIGLTTLFVFTALGSMANAEGIGAILAGIAIRNLVPNKELEKAEFGIKSLAYSFLGPIFFAWVGMSINLNTIMIFPLLTIAFYIIPMIAKIAASWLVMFREFGKLHSLFAGIALSVRFSTELVVAQLLFTHGIIDPTLFTAIVASSALATIINPLLLVGMIREIGIRKIKSPART